LKLQVIINPDGSVYHLGLNPGDLAATVLTVGDPERVELVSRMMDDVYFTKNSREFVTHTGRIANKDISVISTGIGTDNIDIVLNEIDALVNVDFGSRTENKIHKSLNIIRLGTTGLIQPNAQVDQILLSELAIDASGLSPWYNFEQTEEEKDWRDKLDVSFPKQQWSVHASNKDLLNHFSQQFDKGITYTASGFYGPQGRHIRVNPNPKNMLEILASITLRNQKIDNIEMETAGIYGLAKVLGHRALAINAALANRTDGKFSANPAATVEKMIEQTFELLETL